MALIAGYIDKRLNAEDSDLAEKMDSALRIEGVNSKVISWKGAFFGIAQDACNRQPLLRQDSALMMTSARLDNPSDLAETLHTREEDHQRLVLQSFKQWDQKAPEHLYGDWALAAWDGTSLFLARDKLGFLGLYFYKGPDFFAFATSLKVLRALPKVPWELSEEYFLRYLAVIPDNDLSRSYWKDIRLLLPGRHLVYQPENQTLTIKRYWDFANVPEIRFDKVEDYLEAFSERFGEAVRVRMSPHNRVATTLSAGLDSASVTALAATFGKNKKISAFTAIPTFRPPIRSGQNRILDEWPLASLVAESYPKVEHVPLDSGNVSPVAAIQRYLEIAGHPSHAGINLYWILDLLDKVRDRECSTLLTGAVGNATVSWDGGRDRVYHLLIRGNVGSAVDALKLWKNNQGCSQWLALKRLILSPLFRHLQAVTSARTTRLPGQQWTLWKSIHPALLHGNLFKGLVRDFKHGPYFHPVSPKKQRLAHLTLNTTAIGNSWHSFEFHYGFSNFDPTLDQRLVEFCFGIPESVYTCEGGDRMLIRNSMKGFVPDKVLENRCRGLQGSDIGMRLTTHTEEMEEALAQLCNNPTSREYLNIDYLRKVWMSIKQDPWSPQVSVMAQILLRGIMLHYFINSDQ